MYVVKFAYHMHPGEAVVTSDNFDIHEVCSTPRRVFIGISVIICHIMDTRQAMVTSKKCKITYIAGHHEDITPPYFLCT